MTFRSLHNRRNFFSDYWLGTLLASRAGAPRLTAQELRRRMRHVERLVDRLAGVAQQQPARFRERFAKPLLVEVFDYHVDEATVAEDIYMLRASADAGEALALVCLCADAATLDSRHLRNEVDAALAGENLDHALMVTPETLRLVRRAGDSPRYSSLDLALGSVRELQDAESLHAAYRVLSARSFVRGADGRRPIDVLEAESREHSAKVSRELKDAVFTAAEQIVGALLRDVDARPDAFPDPKPGIQEVGDAGFLALYRILFVLYAESRDERLARHSLYRESYALETLVARLLETPPDMLPSNRVRLWSRLRALFSVFNEGLAPNLPDMENIPPRGGTLFSDFTPEGALLARLQLDDRACAGVLLAIATTKPRRGIGRERVSFRELEIEQLGAVYEGLLEYEPAIADELRVLVNIGGREVSVTPDELSALCRARDLRLGGDPGIVAGTTAESLHPDSAAEDDDEEFDDDEEDIEEDEAPAVKRGQLVRLVRRLEPSTFFFRPGGARKASGSYYTPTPMVDYLVRESLGPLTAGKRAAEIEQLRVVDLACGSAHFLVGASRFLGEKLHAAYRAECGENPPPAFAPPDVQPATMRARWADEGLAWCRRRIIERCLYGVDLNPAAVQLARVALWIESLAGDRPLSFFQHHIRVGNSLQGTFVDRFDSPPDPNLAIARRDAATLGLFESNIRQRIESALGERRLIDAELPPEIRGDSPAEFEYKEDRLRRSDAALAPARLLMDLRSAAPFKPAIWPELAELSQATDPERAARARPWWADFERIRARERFFHWELEFPEVLLRDDRPGFDVVLGNPPWDKVLPTRREFYSEVDPLIIAFKGHEMDQRIARLHRDDPSLRGRFDAERERTTTFARVLRKGGNFPLARPAAEEDEEGVLRDRRRSDGSAHEDLSKYFVDRALRLTRAGGALGYVIPSVVYNGDGCVGIRQFLFREAEVAAFYGFENRKRIFPIDSRYKFAELVARKSGRGTAAFDAAFMRHDVAELAEPGSGSWMVRVTRDEVEQLSPETLAFLEYRGPRDQEIVRKMSQGKPTFGGSGPGSWGTRLISWRQHEVIFNATEDRDLFTTPDGARLHSPQSVLGARVPADPAQLPDAMRAAGFWPVYEGKHIDQYLVGVKPVRWWLSVEQARAKYNRSPREQPTLVFRETASNTNQRTCIAAVLPARSAASHTCTAADFEHVSPDAALSVLNSFCFDFLLRLRAAGTHVSFTYIQPVAVPSAQVTSALPRLPSRFAPAAGISHLEDDEGFWPIIWSIDRAVAEAYSLTPQDLAHILATFPVWRRKRPRLANYYEARLKDWLNK